ncbi:MAG: hypothetical protein ACLRMJ_11655 [Alistipes finegoldii]
MKTETTLSRPVRIVVMAPATGRINTSRPPNPEQLRLAAIVEVNDLRRRAMADAFGLRQVLLRPLRRLLRRGARCRHGADFDS